tara:strand:+ start:1576 stop:2871 length:1296 start_codon:yes stop_codon:yes gene_type:complete
MNVTVFGMGYVGCITSACLIKQHHNVIGVDIIKSKIDDLNRGKWPIFEPGLKELNRKELMDKYFSATIDEEKAILKSDVLIICVGTPSNPNGDVDLSYLQTLIKRINKFIGKYPKDYLIILRSTVPFGTTRSLLKASFKEHNFKINLCFVPEFLREGSALSDYFNPSIKVVGCDDEDFNIEILDRIFSEMAGEWEITTFEIAESIKYISNSWHALKIVFTNEIARILKHHDLDSKNAMELFCQDKVLNISSNYMKPGFAYGGSCLPKEIKALNAFASNASIKTPLLNAIPDSNETMINSLEQIISSQKSNRIGFIGITFKPNTDDIRNSPILFVINSLITNKNSYQKQFTITIYDNKEAVSNLDNITSEKLNIVNNTLDMIENADIIVLGTLKISLKEHLMLLQANKKIIDLKWHDVPKKISNYSNYISIV